MHNPNHIIFEFQLVDICFCFLTLYFCSILLILYLLVYLAAAKFCFLYQFPSSFFTSHHFSEDLKTVLSDHTVPKIRKKYSQKWICAASFLNSIFMYLCSINIFPRSVHLFFCIAFADWSWDYINHSQIHEPGNWERGRAISFLGIFVSNFRYSAFAVRCKYSIWQGWNQWMLC
jgi:hypothetical protein